MKKPIGICIVLLAVTLSWGTHQARADFELPISNQVPKIISVPSDVDLEKLERFVGVRNLTIEIRASHGNLLPGRLFKMLLEKFNKSRKQIVLSGKIRQDNVDQLRRLKNLEILYDVGRLKLEPSTINELYSLGPVHKTVILNDKFDKDLLTSVLGLKFTDPAIRVPKGTLSEQQIELLSRDKKKKKTILISSSTTVQDIYELSVISPLAFEVLTTNNRIENKLFKVLTDLSGVDLTLVVNGRLTIDDAKKFARLERFKLKIVLDKDVSSIPGLVQLLNKIAPP
jgi:hypothetical protein